MASQDQRGISPFAHKTLRAAAVLVFLIIAISYFATERAGDYWGDDFALYVHHAKNIASGVPYAQTGYLFNPLTPDYSPRVLSAGIPTRSLRRLFGFAVSIGTP